MTCSAGVRRVLTAITIVGLSGALAACGSSSPASTGSGKPHSASTSPGNPSVASTSTKSSGTRSKAGARASSGTGASSGTAGSAGATTSATVVQARLNLAKCFRAHGINIPNPSPAHPGAVSRALKNYSQSQISAVLQDCRAYASQAFPVPNLRPAQLSRLEQGLAKFAACLRSHGVKISNPKSGSGGLSGFRQAFEALDRNSPKVRSAVSACRSSAPHLPHAGP